MICHSFFIDGIRIPSENYLYKPVHRRGRAFLYKNTTVKNFQTELKEKIQPQLENIMLPPQDSTNGILSCYNFGIAENFWKKDVTNMVKAPEDALFSLLPFDDSEVIWSSGKKIVSEHDFLLISLCFLFDADYLDECFYSFLKYSERILTEEVHAKSFTDY